MFLTFDRGGSVFWSGLKFTAAVGVSHVFFFFLDFVLDDFAGVRIWFAKWHLDDAFLF